MAAHRNRELEKKIEDLLKSPVRTKDDLASLFCKLLGFQYAGRVLSSRDQGIWGDSDAARIAADQKFEILAGHGDVASGGFAIIYGELKPFNLSVQRTLILQLRNNFPAAIFLFADRDTVGGTRGARVHIVHAKLSGPVSGDGASQRLILRRFRVGPGERYRTAAERLAKLDISQRPHIGTLELGDICDVAFDKEALTDEFFKKLDRHIREIETDLKKYQPDFTPQDAFTQAQLLIERLVFLYFAQNRGWLNQEADYLIQNFQPHRKKTDEFTYYSDFLLGLFRKLSDQNYGNQTYQGIPFLNGGLFDDDEFRPATAALLIRNETFAALFEDLLEAYNFTVREDTPLSQEVAVDPEMLGKIFESIVLHAESAGEEFQAPDKRKATGSYYTPRIVVHFICRETLRLYFVNRAASLADAATRDTWSERISRLFKEIEPDDGFNEAELKTLRAILSPTEAKRCLALLNVIRTLDPSVGSGAFPVGLLHELVSLRRVFECVVNGYQDPVKGEGSPWKQKAKEHFIQSSLFGVDIQQQAIEICRLRLWLSLLVDYELGVNPFEAERGKFIEAINHISQLPNLEMNFRRGDSLHDYICGHPVRLDGTQLADYTDDLARIEKSGQELHQAKRAEKKKRLRLEILAQRLDLGKRVVTDQIRALSTNQQVGDLFGLTGSDAATQRRVDAETARLRDALKQLEKDEKEFQRVQAKPMDKNFYRNLRKLEGAEPDGPHNFVWRLDFPHVLSEKDKGTVLDNLALVNEAGQGELVKAKSKSAAGFDLIVGNPPFVTARNAEKRELYRARWPTVCHKKFLLVCPFFELSFALLKPDGQLGFIVSNAFAKRDLGQPLIEDFFPTIDLQKLVDCSGLMFPGHGTPTCLVFGAQRKPDEKLPIRVSAILPGGGDLQTSPEESPLWHTLAAQHDNPGFVDSRVVVADRLRKEMGKWPWNFDSDAEPTKKQLELNESRFGDLVDSIGVAFFTNADEVFLVSGSLARRQHLPNELLVPCQVGDEIRNWVSTTSEFVLKPYDSNWKPLKLTYDAGMEHWLKMFRKPLGARATFAGPSYDEAGKLWYGYHIINEPKLLTALNIAFTEIATHGHFVTQAEAKLFKQTAPIIKLPANLSIDDHHLLASALNSSGAMFWLKQVCFNKGAGEDEHRDRFVFAGGKVEMLPVPSDIAVALRSSKPNKLVEKLISLSRACWESGRELPSLALRKLFEKSGEAYAAWNAALPGHVAPHAKLAAAFTTTAELQERFARAVSLREQLRAGMVARQEEMDWLVYAAYGLLPAEHPAAQVEAEPAPLDQAQRPFRLWESAGGDFAQAVALIPGDWPKPRRALWEARLAAIRDSEHIRRIEQPVYKRRWDEQWKVGNRWMAGQVAYAQEFVDAFRWWLAEKAEWLLEHKAAGGPVELGGWIPALWKDKRIEAAWPVVADAIHQIGQFKFDASESEAKKLIALDASYDSFAKFLKDTVMDETVPAGIPPAISWDDLAAKKKFTTAQLKKAQAVRGKLNVPRERFQVTGGGEFVWAGQ